MKTICGIRELIFDQVGTWAAAKACEEFLFHCGFSIGRSERGSPRGVLYGDFDISKWHNLRPADRDGLHAIVTGDGREGPLTLTILPTCPEAGLAVLSKASSHLADASPKSNSHEGTSR